MLFALRHPAILLGLVVGFLVGIALRAAVQQRVTGVPRARSWAAYLDPYGTVAAVIAGVGWGARVAPRRGRRGGDVAMLVAALAVHGVLAIAGFVAYRAASGPRVLGDFVSVVDVIHGSVALGTTAAQVSLGFAVENLACGLLALLPIPPLELGLLLWRRLPQSPGARRFAYHLLEEAWGVAVVLIGLLLPLAGQAPALLALLNSAGDPLLRLV